MALYKKIAAAPGTPPRRGRGGARRTGTASRRSSTGSSTSRAYASLARALGVRADPAPGRRAARNAGEGPPARPGQGPPRASERELAAAGPDAFRLPRAFAGVAPARRGGLRPGPRVFSRRSPSRALSRALPGVRSPAGRRRERRFPLGALVALSRRPSSCPACAERGAAPCGDPSVVALVGDRPVGWDDVAAYLKERPRRSRRTSRRAWPRAFSTSTSRSCSSTGRSRTRRRPPRGDRGRAAPCAHRAGGRRGDDLGRRPPEGVRVPRRTVSGGPALVRVSQLLFRSTRGGRSRAAAARRRGSPGSEISRTKSLAPNAATGGPLGLLARTDLPREFEKDPRGCRPGRRPGSSRPRTAFTFSASKSASTCGTSPSRRRNRRCACSWPRNGSVKAAADLVAGRTAGIRSPVVEEHLPFPYVGTNPRYVAPSR